MSRKVAIAAAAAGAAMAAALGLSIKAAADFEAQMVEAGKTIQGFGEHRQDLEELAKTMSIRWATSTREVANAMGFLGSMGQDALEVQDNMNAVMEVGIALQLDMEQAARMVSSAQAIFNKENLTATQIGDKLNAVTNATAASTDFLSGALRMAGPAAAATGTSMDQLLGILTPLAAAGFQGSMAGRALNTILPAIKNNATELTEGLGRLKSQGFDVNMEAMKGFEEASPFEQIVALSEATKNLTDDQKRQLAEFIGGTQFFKQMFVLLEGGESVLTGLGISMDSFGSASEEALKTTQTFNFRLDQLKQRVTFLGVDIGSRLLPAMNSFMDVIEDMQPGLQGAADSVGTFAASLFDALAGLATGEVTLGDIGENIKTGIEDTSWDGVFEGLETAAGTAWAFVTDSLVPTAEGLSSWFADVDWGPLWTSFKEWTLSLPGKMADWIIVTGEDLNAWFEGVEWEDAFVDFGAWLGDIGIWAKDMIGSMDDALAQLVLNTDWAKFLLDVANSILDAPFLIGYGIGTKIREAAMEAIFGDGLQNLPQVPPPSYLGPDYVGPPVFPEASGGSGLVTSPTLFLAGEAGPEFFKFTPSKNEKGRGNITIGQLIIQGNTDSQLGRQNAARDLVEQMGKEWRLI